MSLHVLLIYFRLCVFVVLLSLQLRSSAQEEVYEIYIKADNEKNVIRFSGKADYLEVIEDFCAANNVGVEGRDQLVAMGKSLVYPKPKEFLHNNNNNNCFNGEVVYVTSFNAKWYEQMKENSFRNTILEFPLSQALPLIIYHEDDLPADVRAIPNVCTIDLRAQFDWLEYEIHNEDSGLNKYFKLSSYFDPFSNPKKRVTIKYGHVLLFKAASIYHAIHSTRVEGSLVFWLDTDVTIRDPLPTHAIDWLRKRDVTYVPFYVYPSNFNRWLEFNLNKISEEKRLMNQEWWRIESGVVAFSVNERTRAFAKKAIDLYRGGMYWLAKACFNKFDHQEEAKFCKKLRVKNNLYLNDVFVFSLLLHSDIHKDSLFHVNLTHGWFAVKGLEPWGSGLYAWGNGMYEPNFIPSVEPNRVISNFYIGQYLFHYMGYHDTGVYSSQVKETIDEGNYKAKAKLNWRVVDDTRHFDDSMYRYLQEKDILSTTM